MYLISNDDSKRYEPHINCPTSGRVITLKTGRREVPGSNTGRAFDLAVRSFP